MIVVDASTWVDYLIGTLDNAHRTVLLNGGAASPPHVDFEVGSALLRQERRGHLATGAANALIVEFSAMPFQRQCHPDDASAAVGLLDNTTYADALYVAMARRVESSVMTSDSGMVECARIAQVEVIETMPA